MSHEHFLCFGCHRPVMRCRCGKVKIGKHNCLLCDSCCNRLWREVTENLQQPCRMHRGFEGSSHIELIDKILKLYCHLRPHQVVQVEKNFYSDQIKVSCIHKDLADKHALFTLKWRELLSVPLQGAEQVIYDKLNQHCCNLPDSPVTDHPLYVAKDLVECDPETEGEEHE